MSWLFPSIHALTRSVCVLGVAVGVGVRVAVAVTVAVDVGVNVAVVVAVDIGANMAKVDVEGDSIAAGPVRHLADSSTGYTPALTSPAPTGCTLTAPGMVRRKVIPTMRKPLRSQWMIFVPMVFSPCFNLYSVSFSRGARLEVCPGSTIFNANSLPNLAPCHRILRLEPNQVQQTTPALGRAKTHPWLASRWGMMMAVLAGPPPVAGS